MEKLLLLVFVCVFGVSRMQQTDDGLVDEKIEHTIDKLLSVFEDERKRNALLNFLKTRNRNKKRLSASDSMEDTDKTLTKASAEADLMDNDKRDAVQLADMVRNITGTNPFKYLSYGCYCGLGGKGEPVDELDRCCLTHDRCYGKLTKDYGCSEYWRYFNTYVWSIGSNGDIICNVDVNKCKEGQCLCDKEMALCFQQHHTVYNDKYTGWWWTIWKKYREC